MERRRDLRLENKTELGESPLRPALAVRSFWRLRDDENPARDEEADAALCGDGRTSERPCYDRVKRRAQLRTACGDLGALANHRNPLGEAQRGDCCSEVVRPFDSAVEQDERRLRQTQSQDETAGTPAPLPRSRTHFARASSGNASSAREGMGDVAADIAGAEAPCLLGTFEDRGELGDDSPRDRHGGLFGVFAAVVGRFLCRANHDVADAARSLRRWFRAPRTQRSCRGRSFDPRLPSVPVPRQHLRRRPLRHGGGRDVASASARRLRKPATSTTTRRTWSSPWRWTTVRASSCKASSVVPRGPISNPRSSPSTSTKMCSSSACAAVVASYPKRSMTPRTNEDGEIDLFLDAHL